MQKETKRFRFKKPKGFKKWCTRHHFKPLTIIIALIIIAVLATGTGIALSTVWSHTESRTVELGLKDIGELATQSAYFTNVQTIEKAREILGITIPFTDSKYVFSYDGVIKAGVDFGDITVDTDSASKTITVHLPAFKVLSVEVFEDSLQVYNESESIYTPLKVDDMNTAMSKLKTEAQEKAVSNGLMDAARENAETLIKTFISGFYGTDSGWNVKFTYADGEAGA